MTSRFLNYVNSFFIILSCSLFNMSSTYAADNACAPSSIAGAFLISPQGGFEITKTSTKEKYKLVVKNVNPTIYISVAGTFQRLFDGTMDLSQYPQIWSSCKGMLKTSNAMLYFKDKNGKLVELLPILANPVFDMTSKTITYDAYFRIVTDDNTGTNLQLDKEGRYVYNGPAKLQTNSVVNTQLDDPILKDLGTLIPLCYDAPGEIDLNSIP